MDYRWIYEWISSTQCIVIFDEEHTEKLLKAVWEERGKVSRLQRAKASRCPKDDLMNQIYYDVNEQILYVVPAPTAVSFHDVMDLEACMALAGERIS